jgi:EAL domain-containing protein (putative c-di-GMP-specific phosphodiesterase class I)
MENGFVIHDAEINLNVSIGIAMHNSSSESASEILKHADAAMYHAKHSGKNQYCFFNIDILKELSERKEIELSIRKALEDDEFKLLFMPIYQCNNLKMIGAEVLIRSTSKKLSEVGPEKYIPIAESHGLIREIDLWVIENTFIKIKNIIYRPGMENLWFAINISALELHNRQFPEKVKQLLHKHDIPPHRIEFEVTETSLVSQDEISIATLNKLKKLGVSLSLDDFGTGYTAFNQLMNYPVNNLKLDRSFVSNIASQDKNHASMVDIVLTIANSYNMKVVAEGVETKEQLQYLQKLNCNYVQGYLLSKPIEWTEFMTYFQDEISTEKIKKMNFSYA